MILVQTGKFKWLFSARGSVLAIALLLTFPGDLYAAQATLQENTPAVVSQTPSKVPNLSEIIPLSAELSSRLAQLENTKPDLPDLAEIEKSYAEIAGRIDAVSKKLDQLKNKESGSNIKGLGIMQTFTYDEDRLNKINIPLDRAIRQLDALDSEWLAEKQRWQEWRNTSFKNRLYHRIGAAFDEADSTIKTALDLISRQMDSLLAVQADGARLKAKIARLVDAESTVRNAKVHQQSLLGKSPPIYSLDYFTQFNGDMWGIAWENLKFVPWPGKEFFILHGLEFGLFVICVIGLFALIYRKRNDFAVSENWSFLAERPFATVLFVTTLFATVRMQFWTPSSELVLTLLIVIGSMSCLRLLVRVLDGGWEKKVSCGVMSFYAITALLIMIEVPAPIFNLFILIASIVTLTFSIKWIREYRLSGSGSYPLWGARVLALWFAIVIITEIMGETGIAYSMFVNSVITLAVVSLIVLFIYMLQGGIHWVFFSSPLWQVKLMRSDAQKNERRVLVITEVLIFIFLLLPAILSIWDIYDNFPDAISGLLSPGFVVGGQKITIGLGITAIATLYGSFYFAQVAPKVLLDEQIMGRQMDRGVRGSIGHLIRYFIIFVGLLLTVSMLGFSLTNLTIILSALGVGIGFGLQGIVNNFVSGLILLFERPIREGDTIVLGEQWAQIKTIGMRATIIQTFDLAEVVIPNADMINNHVTNWTLSNRKARLSIPVGVDYGSDVALVVETLQACANDHETVLKSPDPEVLFLNLGDSSLDFELRVWIQDTDNRLYVTSQLLQEIIRRFREKGIVIPFPQRDVHLYGGAGTNDQSLKQPLGNELPSDEDATKS
ncbi:MAG: mechanosensitive ion channel family protein [Desulfuromonadales bacterium]